MVVPLRPARHVRFADFELALGAGELRRNGVPVPIPEQPLRLLEVLLEHPGELVSRDQLQQRLWPANTFVDFEHGLNAAVKRLRDALGDSAEAPQFIETVPKRGYRFIASVQRDKASEPPHPTVPGQRAGESGKGPRARRRLVIGAAAGALLLLIALGVSRVPSLRHPPAPVASPMQFPLDTPPGQQLWQVELSPDGRRLAVWTHEELLEPGTFPLRSSIWVRRLDSPGWRRLAVLQVRPWFAWTSDSRSLLFSGSGELRGVDVETGVSRVVARTSGMGPLSHPDGSILIGGPRLQRIAPGSENAADFGAAAPGTQLQIPQRVLADGRLLVTQITRDPKTTGVFIWGPAATTRLLPVPSNVVITRSSHLVFGRDGVLFTQAFDAGRGELVGRPEHVVADVARFGGYHFFTLGPDDTLVWRPEGVTSPRSKLEWFDRNGRPLGTVGETGAYRQLDLSPDGHQVAVEWYGARIGILDLNRSTVTPLRVLGAEGAPPVFLGDPVWASDGQRLAVTAGASMPELHLSTISITSRETEKLQVVLSPPPGKVPEAWSADGQHIVYIVNDPPHQSLWAVTPGGERTPVRLTPDGLHSSDQAQLSPDDRWLAYTSDETGDFEIYLQPFLREGRRRRISSAGGGQPRWRGDGRELFYLTRDGTMMSVTFSPSMEPSVARALFRGPIDPLPLLDRYVVSRDGQRFLGIVPTGDSPRPRISALVNWRAGRSMP
jgi:eukaryotic-like serine/threonine-protein kinase